MGEEKKSLGALLNDVRTLKEWSLNRVAKEANISAAYLQKLERNEVKTPSPRILHDLAKVLDVSYTGLMKLAGYIVSSEKDSGTESLKLLAQAFHSQNLTEDEIRELAEYLAVRRKMRK